MPPELGFDLSGRFREFRLQKSVGSLPNGFFLGPAVKFLCAVIPKNNSAAAEATYENGVVARKQKSGLFFTDSFEQIVPISLPSTILAHD
jgi:hypothetical protein